MRAIEVESFGGPDVMSFRELPDPRPGHGQLLVAAVASDVLFVDTLVRSGRGVDYFPVRPPYVPGNGVGGRVVALGDGVDPNWLGREVVAHTGGAGGTGGYAELAAVDDATCVAVPDGVDLMDATAVLHDGTTAQRVLEATGPGEWERVLVLGAAGGMGILLVQLLVARGAYVVGAVRGSAKRAVATHAGAVTVDYGADGWTDGVLEAMGGHRPTVVLDGVGGVLGGAAFGLIADGGRFSAHGSSSGSFASIPPDAARDRGVRVTSIADLSYGEGDRTRLLRTVLAEVASGKIAPFVGQTFALGEAAKAHQAIEARETVAKTLLLAGI